MRLSRLSARRSLALLSLLTLSACDTLGWREGGEQWGKSMCRTERATCTCEDGSIATRGICPVNDSDVLKKKP